MDIVRKIIRAYLYNPMPEKVQRQFRSWCLREEGSHEKTEALRGGVGAARSRRRASDG